MQISLKSIRQIAAEVLAYAVMELFPGSQLVKGDASDVGFYYDFVLTLPLTKETLFIIEERMRAIFKEFLEVEQIEMMRENAIQFFLHHSQPFKAQELENFEDNIVPIIKIGAFYDVKVAPFKELKVAEFFKLQSVENKIISTYFYDKNGHKQYEKLKVLRINGTACTDKKELKAHLKQLESAKNQDYLTLGCEMGLFAREEASFSEEFLCWLPKGQFVKERLLNFLRVESKKLKFEAVSTPRIVKKIFADKDDLQVEIEGEDYSFCKEKFKLHALLYRAEKQFQEELPLRYFEIEDDSESATIFCTEEGAHLELISCLQLMDKIAKILDLESRYILNKGKAKGSSKKTVEMFEKALNSLNLEFAVDKESVNEYINSYSITGMSGPSIELEVCDALKRKWYISSVQIIDKPKEFFDLSYVDRTGKNQTPVMISRSIFRSLKQFIALLIERESGLFPLWLVQTEVMVLPIAERNIAYAKEIVGQLKDAEIRVSLDESPLKLGEKIQKAQKKIIPYMLIVGDNETKNGTVAVRTFSQEKDSVQLSLNTFLEQFAYEKEKTSYLR